MLGGSNKPAPGVIGAGGGGAGATSPYITKLRQILKDAKDLQQEAVNTFWDPNEPTSDDVGKLEQDSASLDAAEHALE